MISGTFQGKESHPAPFSPRCSSYWKESLQVALGYGRPTNTHTSEYCWVIYCIEVLKRGTGVIEGPPCYIHHCFSDLTSTSIPICIEYCQFLGLYRVCKKERPPVVLTTWLQCNATLSVTVVSMTMFQAL